VFALVSAGRQGCCPKNPFAAEAAGLCPAGRALRALPLIIPVAYGRKRKERDLRQSRRQKNWVSKPHSRKD